LTGLIDVFVSWSDISWYNWCVIKKVEKSAAVASEYDLLFGALDRGCEFSSVSLL
jgi:hypothetical protein